MIPDFNILNPKTDNKMPFFNAKKGIFYFPVNNTFYKYYIEASRITEDGITEYYILVGANQFDSNCRKCHVDDYKRCQIRPKGEIKDYIVQECNERGNLNVSFYEQGNGYDIYKLD